MTPNRQGTAAPPMLEENGSTRDQVKKDEPSSHWFIHGKAYDLANFAQEHPGGAAIILDSCGRDATPLFESYHAFANRTYIMGKLATYEVPIEAQHKVVAVPLYSFDDNGFYKTVVRRVRGHFKKDVTPKISVTSKIKANWIWYIKIMLQLSALTVLSLFTFAPNLLLSLLPTGTFQGYWTLLGLNLICAFLTGVFFIQVGFTIMHDASHFAISAHNGWQNEVFARCWCALSLWRYELWMHHHSVLHHAYTARYQYVGIDFDNLVSKHGFAGTSLTALWVIAVYAFLPGMWVGQIAAYWLIWNPRGHLWRMGRPNATAFPRRWYETVLNVVVVFAHLYRSNPLVSWSLFVGCNVAYAVCILPDHDTLTTVENHIIHGEINQPDWGEVQVRHSANFATRGISGAIFASLFGGINFQIEHHLFPGMSHVHYRDVSKIVQATCKEYDIPYEAFPSVSGALLDFVRNVQTQMKNRFDEKDVPRQIERTKAL